MLIDVECEKCGKEHEILVKDDTDIPLCIKCGCLMKRKFGAEGVKFKFNTECSSSTKKGMLS